jgi:hypothetical protein
MSKQDMLNYLIRSWAAGPSLEGSLDPHAQSWKKRRGPRCSLAVRRSHGSRSRSSHLVLCLAKLTKLGYAGLRE